MHKRGYLSFIFSWFCLSLLAQQKGLILGRNIEIPAVDSLISMHFSERVPHSELSSFTCILVFSSAHSRLTKQDIDAIQNYVNEGGNLYIGADNWPFVSESDQLTEAFYGLNCWGNKTIEKAFVNPKNISASTVFSSRDSIPSGNTTVSLPLDYRLSVAVWSGDDPLILVGKYGLGTIVRDGGYARFNTALMNSAELQSIFKELLIYLMQ